MEYGKETGLTNYGSGTPPGEHQYGFRAGAGDFQGGLVTAGGSDPAAHELHPQWGGPDYTNAEFYGEGEHQAVGDNYRNSNPNYGVK